MLAKKDNIIELYPQDGKLLSPIIKVVDNRDGAPGKFKEKQLIDFYPKILMPPQEDGYIKHPSRDLL